MGSPLPSPSSGAFPSEESLDDGAFARARTLPPPPLARASALPAHVDDVACSDDAVASPPSKSGGGRGASRAGATMMARASGVGLGSSSAQQTKQPSGSASRTAYGVYAAAHELGPSGLTFTSPDCSCDESVQRAGSASSEHVPAGGGERRE